MWSSRFFWKLLLAYGALYALFVVPGTLLLASHQKKSVAEQISQRLSNDAIMLRSVVADRLVREQYADLPSLIQELGRQTQTRLTIIAPNGTVLADTHENRDRVGNQGNRPEVLQAKKEGIGTSVRHSSTLGRQFHYLAIPVASNRRTYGFVRTAVEAERVDARLAELHRNLFALTLAITVLIFPLIYLIARSVIHPIREMMRTADAMAGGDFSRRIIISNKDEFGQMAAALNASQERLDSQLSHLQKNSDRMSTVLSGMVEGVLAVDPETRVLLANQASIELLEITAKEIVGRPLLEVARNRDVQQTIQDALGGSRPQAREIAVAKTPRRILRLLATKLPGDPSPGVVVVFHDVTELRRLESLRRDFVANVSHELKTPLAAIKAYAETLRLGALNDPDNNLNFVSRIEDQANRLHRLIVDLLHIARVESGREAFEFSPVPLAQAAEECVSQYAEAARQADVRVTVEPSTEEVFAWADYNGVRTIIENLLSNAIRYTPAGGHVTLRWRNQLRYAVIEVQDTGIGIAPHDQQRIFERFYRVDRARSRELGGTGLGLAIVKHLLQAFGGEINLNSEPGKGSIFTVRLPIPGGESTNE